MDKRTKEEEEDYKQYNMIRHGIIIIACAYCPFQTAKSIFLDIDVSGSECESSLNEQSDKCKKHDFAVYIGTIKLLVHNYIVIIYVHMFISTEKNL